MTPPRLVLASTSPYRRRVLERIGVPFEVAAPDFDERQPLPPEVRSPQAIATWLAHGKARAVARRPDFADAWVIGSDQIVCLADAADTDAAIALFHKPGTVDAAVEQLLRLQGRAHLLVTAVVVHANGHERAEVDTHTMHMTWLDAVRARSYVDADQPLDCAGSYRIEQRGLTLFDRIDADPECADDTAIMGLPLWKTLRALRGLGFDLLS